MRILLVEDNQSIAKNIKTILELQSYAVDIAFDGEAGERQAAALAYDAIILDVMLPKKDGLSVCKNLRSANIMTPVLILTALGEVDDRVEGLDSGADDYLAKPFAMQELLARLRALLRRPAESHQEVMDIGGIHMDLGRHEVTVRGTRVRLTVKEFAVLEYLLRNRGVAVPRDEILRHCWDFASSPFSNIVDAHIKQLRKKLSDHHGELIETIRGIGYRIA